MNKILLSILVSNLLFAQSTLLQDIEVIATDENSIDSNILFIETPVFYFILLV